MFFHSNDKKEEKEDKEIKVIHTNIIDSEQ